MNWFDIADKSDVRAHRFYEDLLEGKAGGNGWIDTWVKVPRKCLIDVHHESGERHDWLWTGLEWVKVYTYEGQKGLYVRLPDFSGD